MDYKLKTQITMLKLVNTEKSFMRNECTNLNNVNQSCEKSSDIFGMEYISTNIKNSIAGIAGFYLFIVFLCWGL